MKTRFAAPGTLLVTWYHIQAVSLVLALNQVSYSPTMLCTNIYIYLFINSLNSSVLQRYKLKKIYLQEFMLCWSCVVSPLFSNSMVSHQMEPFRKTHKKGRKILQKTMPNLEYNLLSICQLLFGSTFSSLITPQVVSSVRYPVSSKHSSHEV